MLMKNNFIHADCHGGNIIIEMNKPKVSFLGELADYAR
jgi:predicted unusual protein kinase regulating ubiquinone biosynthesis (AarF/ABC1/UbiB family)